MKTSAPYLNREEQAMREAGRTIIRRSTAWLVSAVFLAVICAVPLVQMVHDARAFRAGTRASAWPQCFDIFRRLPAAGTVFHNTPGSTWTRVLAANRRLLQEMHAYESALEDESVVGQAIRPPVQYVLARGLGAGNEKAYCGVHPWLFYRADVDYLTGPGFLNPAQLARRAAGGDEWQAPPQPDPRPAILEFYRQLKERGIELIIAPIPPKSIIQPEKFYDRFKAGAAKLQNPSYADFILALREAGVPVADVTPVLAGLHANRAEEKGVFLAADTHWRPEAVEAAARWLKQYIEEQIPLPQRPDPGYRAQLAGVTNRGDLAVMLRLPACPSMPERRPGSSAMAFARGYPPEAARLRRILTARGDAWRPDETSDVLVLGDSYCNIYSLAAMGWGDSAGLIEQLSFELRRPLDCLVINDNGAHAARALLARELARGRDRLAGKRLVIWQFAMRELTAGDWKSLPLALGKRAPAVFLVPAPGESLLVHGVVRDIAPIPRPGTVPYKDHIAAACIVDLEFAEQAVHGNQALVYLQSMRDNVWTPAARLRPGDSVTLSLRPWSDAAAQYERINRTELPDDALQLAEPCWGELAPAGR